MALRGFGVFGSLLGELFRSLASFLVEHGQFLRMLHSSSSSVPFRSLPGGTESHVAGRMRKNQKSNAELCAMTWNHSELFNPDLRQGRVGSVPARRYGLQEVSLVEELCAE